MKKLRSLLIPLLAVLAVTAIAGFGALKRLDRWAQDSLFQNRGATDTDIVIFGIDDVALEEFGPFPWSRDVIAEALEMLASDPDHLPAVVAVDVLYAGRSSAIQTDARLTEAALALSDAIYAEQPAVGAPGEALETARAALREVLSESGDADARLKAAAQGLLDAADAEQAAANESDERLLAAAMAFDDAFYAIQAAPAQADAHLVKAAGALGNVVTGCLAVFDETTGAVLGVYQPYDALRDVTVQGHINAQTDKDGVMRHTLLYMQSGEEQIYSLAFQAARLYREAQGGALALPATTGGYGYISYTGEPGDYYDGHSVAHLVNGTMTSQVWAGKIVLIGPYAAALGDEYFTPIDKGRSMYGIEFHANVIQSLLEGTMKREAEDLPQLIVLFVLCAAAMLLFTRLKVLPGLGACLGVMALGIGVPMLLFRQGLVTHPLWLPVCALALYIISLALHYARAVEERHLLALEKERIGAELALATRIQANSLPKEFPPFPDRHEFDLYASMTPAKEVGGDFYDFFLIDDDHLAMVIADVSGKGVPAALFMMVSKVLVHNAAMGDISPARALQLANRQLCDNNPEEMFVTVWLGVLEISTGRLVTANAGHEIPALKTAGGDFELLKSKHGFVLGGMEMTRYREVETVLEPGAKVFVYTDGVPEATNASEELFGTDRMIEALRACQDGSPERILESVRASVDAFVGAAPQFDDLTMLCLEYKGGALSEQGAALPEGAAPEFSLAK